MGLRLPGVAGWKGKVGKLGMFCEFTVLASIWVSLRGLLCRVSLEVWRVDVLDTWTVRLWWRDRFVEQDGVGPG